MKATIVEWDQLGNYETEVGQVINVVGFVMQHDGVHAVWHDEDGYLWTIHTRFIRARTPEMERDARMLTDLRRAVVGMNRQPLNAIAGPKTVTPRGVR